MLARPNLQPYFFSAVQSENRPGWLIANQNLGFIFTFAVFKTFSLL
jgi:hypothetical protein